MAAEYLEALDEKTRTSKVYKPYQLTGLHLADLLEDREHKSLYIGLAKKHDNQKLINLAADIAQRKDVANKGAYFMKIWFKK